jgi:elongation factor P
VTLVSDVKQDMTLRIDGRLYRVLEIVRHAGSGQMHGFIELKLKEMQFNHFSDRRFKHSDKIEVVELKKRQMDYIFSDVDVCYFMDPETFEQVGVPKSSIGHIEKFLKEGTRITVELLGEQAVSVQFPQIIDARVAATGPGIREGQDNTMKPATLENGVEILVPQFIETGDTIRLDTEKMKYTHRVMSKRLQGA